MKHAFTVKGNVRIVVEFNPNLYSISEVQGLLQWAVQSRNNFEAVQAEIEIKNPMYVEKQLFGSCSSANYFDDEEDEEEFDDSEIEIVEEEPLFNVDKDETENNDDGTDW